MWAGLDPQRRRVRPASFCQRLAGRWDQSLRSVRWALDFSEGNAGDSARGNTPRVPLHPSPIQP